jgi:hypothetical protein
MNHDHDVVIAGAPGEIVSDEASILQLRAKTEEALEVLSLASVLRLPRSLWRLYDHWPKRIPRLFPPMCQTALELPKLRLTARLCRSTVAPRN